MTRMSNIKVDQRTLQFLLTHRLNSGGEAIICRSFKPNILFKIMADSKCQKYCDSFGVPFCLDLIEMPDNKFNKIKKIYGMQLEHSVRPLSTISFSGRLIGYEVTYDPNDKPLAQTMHSYNDLIYF